MLPTSIPQAACHQPQERRAQLCVSFTAGKASKEFDETVEEAEPPLSSEEKGWMDNILTGGSSSLALAFLCNKALFPVRTPITLALTPAVAR